MTIENQCILMGIPYMPIEVVIVKDSEGDIIETLILKTPISERSFKARRKAADKKYNACHSDIYIVGDELKAYREGLVYYFIWYMCKFHGARVVGAYSAQIEE